MTKGWFYRLPSVLALSLVMTNSVFATEWAIYRAGFQVPSLLGSDTESLPDTASSHITPHSLVVRKADGSPVVNNAPNLQRQITEFGLFYGELPDRENLTKYDVEELVGPAGVYIRVRF